MIDIRELVSDVDLIEKMRSNIIARNVDVDLDQVVALYQENLRQKRVLETARAQSNQNAAEVQKATDPVTRTALIESGKKLKAEITQLAANQVVAEEKLAEVANRIPNWMAPDVPIGADEFANKEVARFLEPTVFTFKPKDHLVLGNSLDLVDFESGSKVAGPKFYFLKNEAVLLQHAIKTFVFRKAIESGFTCLHTPDMAKNAILQGTGFSPRGESSNTYMIEGEDLSLVATAEIAVGGMHAGDILKAEDLPLLYVAESHCFRKEAGTAGRSSKGLYRVHQFEKIELFAFTMPEQSEEVHERIRKLEESIYQALKLPYRIVINCSGDLGAPAYKKYDIEAWMPGKGDNGEYGEVTSASNCTTYQSRRLNIRFKNPDTGKNEYVHTLNGTAVALSRTPVAIMENYQTEEGGIVIPDVLRPYMGISYIPPRPDSKSKRQIKFDI
jgi:seryl-tRNA synthetase